jgi:hypothetical protein
VTGLKFTPFIFDVRERAFPHCFRRSGADLRNNAAIQNAVATFAADDTHGAADGRAIYQINGGAATQDCL